MAYYYYNKYNSNLSYIETPTWTYYGRSGGQSANNAGWSIFSCKGLRVTTK